jgi:hypothetical protein
MHTLAHPNAYARCYLLVCSVPHLSRRRAGQSRCWHDPRIDLCEVVNNAVETLEADIARHNHMRGAPGDAYDWGSADQCALADGSPHASSLFFDPGHFLNREDGADETDTTCLGYGCASEPMRPSRIFGNCRTD